MTIRSRVQLCLISVVVAGALAACGGSNSITGATDGADPSASSATIAGTVVAAGVGASPPGTLHASASSGGIQVSVSGTSLTTTTSDDGRFVLGGLTPGETVELHFEGPGIDARLEIEGLVAGQTLTVTVNVSGSTASMLTPADEVEFRGLVRSVGENSLVVDGRTVLVVAGTTAVLGRQNQPISLSDIAVDSFVEVEGWPQPDGSLLGKKVKLEDADGDAENEVEFRGVVESVGADRLVVDSRVVLVEPGTTELLGRQNQAISLSDIVVGSFVEVEGWPQSDGRFLAKKVKLEDNADDEGQEVEFRGTIQSRSPLRVSGTTVSTNGATRILDDDNNPIPLSALQVGMSVEVEGWRQPDDSVLAKKIKVED
jgi:hypothetical protein